MTCDLLVAGGTLVTSAGRRRADIAVTGGVITAILPPGTAPPAARVLEAEGRHVLPGAIDTHVHTRHPGVPEREDFVSGTSAAAAGGITTVCEMPISKAPTNSGPALAARARLLEADAVVDFALYGGAGHQNLDRIAGQADAGAIAFKTFLQPPPPTRLDEFEGLWCTDDVVLGDVMRAVKATGLRHCFHCEHAPLFQALQRRLAAEGRTSGRAHAESRPPVVEELSAAIVLALAEDLSARVQIVHCSSPRTARLARDARWRGVDATVETCPPYLFFTEEALDRLGPFAVCNPPLRGEREVRGLRQCLREGLIEVIGSDHSPFLADDKARGADAIFDTPPGLAGLEVLVPLMLTAAHHGWITLEDVAALLSENAARLFGLTQKGRLQPGADADFTVVDLDAAWRYDATAAVTRARANMRLYDGVELHGRVVSTVVRGALVYHDGVVTGAPGHGRFVRPTRS
ncbi:MAG: dihydroorotase family protein [Vicinamibacterales bacterium]